MKQIMFFFVLLVLLGAPCFGALTYDQSYYRNNAAYLGSGRSNDPLYNLWGVIEGLYEGTEEFDAIRIMESAGATYYTTLSCGDQSANLTFRLPTTAGSNGQVLSTNGSGVLSWVANAGTFAGGTITNDATLNDGVDLLSTTTTAHTNSIQGYADAGARKDVLRWTNGATVAAVLGASDVSFALASTGLDISTGGVLTNVGGLTGTGTFSINDSATTNTTSIGGGTTTGPVSIATGASTQTVNVATGAGAKTLMLGSTNSTSAGTLQAGSGGLTLNTAGNGAIAAGDGTQTIALTSSDWAITTAGVATGLNSLTGNNGNQLDFTTNNAFILSDNSEDLNIGIGANSNTVDLSSSTGVVTIDFGEVDRLTDVEYVAGDNGAQIDLSINERVEFKDAAETIGLILNGSNKVEWATDSGVTTMDFNDIDALEDIETITGDNGQLINFGKNNYIELTENSDTLAFIFGSNKIELAASGDGVDTIDFNDLDALEDIEKITFDFGAFLTQPADNYFEITENSDTLQVIFGSNKWELGAGGTGVDTIDFNDVDALEDIETITGDNGQVILFSKNNYLEFTENSDTLGFIFGSNKIELAASGDGVTEIDCNDIDQFTDVESITGDNGLKIDVSMDERIEFKDGTESFGFLLSGANVIMLTTDSGATDLDMNDVDRLIGVEYITGDNGQKLDFSVNERFEFGDTEKFGFALGTENTVEFVTDSGVTTIDFNDVDNLTDLESITGEGTGVITGFLSTVTNDADGRALVITEAGNTITNAGAGGAFAYVLPEASTCIGARYTFVVMAAFALRVDPADGTDQILLKTNAAGDYYWADAIGETLTVQAVSADGWVVLSEMGTWTEE